MIITETSLSQEEVLELLNKSDHDFVPSLSETLDLELYSKKWSELAKMIVARENGTIVGSIFFYLNQQSSTIYIPLFWTDKQYQRRGVGKGMFEFLVKVAHGNYDNVALEVIKSNIPAISFYAKMGFVTGEDRGSKLLLVRTLD